MLKSAAMTLIDTYKAVAPSVVAFISKIVLTQPGLPPVAPTIFGTGFFVHEDGIVVTNRHVADCFARIPPNPLTGERGYAALLGDYTSSDESERPAQSTFQMMIVEILGHSSVGGDAPGPGWFGESEPDIAFVQLKIKRVPFLKLSPHGDGQMASTDSLRPRGNR